MHVKINHQLFGNVYIADFLVKGVNGDIIVSLKWQQTPGTAEQKIIYEIATLIDIVKSNQSIKKAYLVFGGNGFSQGAIAYMKNQRH
ncbi:MAG: PD-(D/E)XK nuclease superfamily protein [Thermoplasmata archaeon]